MNINPIIVNQQIGGVGPVPGQVAGAAPVTAPSLGTLERMGFTSDKMFDKAEKIKTITRGTGTVIMGKAGESYDYVKSGAVSGISTVGKGLYSMAKTTASAGVITPPSMKTIKSIGKYNTFYKLIFLVVFFVIFLKVIINIFRFFGIDLIDLYSYMGWVIFLMIIMVFIPHDYSTLKLN
jgi:hypothetical protein